VLEPAHHISSERPIDPAKPEGESIEKHGKRRIALIRKMGREFLKLDVILVFGQSRILNRDLCASIGLCSIAPLMEMVAVLEIH
jgi:hypothetical protein